MNIRRIYVPINDEKEQIYHLTVHVGFRILDVYELEQPFDVYYPNPNFFLTVSETKTRMSEVRELYIRQEGFDEYVVPRGYKFISGITLRSKRYSIYLLT